jgi:hypothetical protein
LNIMKFILNTQDLEGSLIQDEINKYVDSQERSYDPRKGGASVLKEFHKIQQELYDFGMGEFHDLLEIFGYIGLKDSHLLPLFDGPNKRNTFIEENNQRALAYVCNME